MDADVLFNLGYAFDTGDGAPVDKAAAVSWYRRAADKGHAKAQLELGRMYYEGDGVPVDKAAAVSWYRKAADQGHADAQFVLRECHKGHAKAQF